MKQEEIKTVDEFWFENTGNKINQEEYSAMIEFAKYHVERALKEANKKATMDIIYRDEAYTNEYNQKYVSAHDVERGGEYGNITVNDSSILNSYPLDLIK